MSRKQFKLAGVLFAASALIFCAEALAAEENVELTVAPAKILPIAAKITGIEATVQDLQARSEDLGAKIQKLGADVATLAVKETETEIRIELSGDILFDFDKSDIRPAAQSALRNVSEMILSFPKGGAKIEGHTDSKGSDDYNMTLSRQRAESVKHWFVANNGLEARKLASQGWGETRPSVSNTKPDGSDNPDGRQKNRRVEVVVMKELAANFDGGPDTYIASSTGGTEGRQAAAAGAAKSGYYEVTANTALRSAPAKSAQILADLRPATRLRVVGSSGDYLEVRSAKGNKPPGYVAKRDVRWIGEKG